MIVEYFYLPFILFLCSKIHCTFSYKSIVKRPRTQVKSLFPLKPLQSRLHLMDFSQKTSCNLCSEHICNLLQMLDFVYIVVFLCPKQVHVCSVLINICLGRCTDLIQDALAGDERFVIGSQSLPLFLENFRLHLAFEILAQLGLLLPFSLNACHFVLVMANLTDSCQSFRVSFCNSRSSRHISSLHLSNIASCRGTSLMGCLSDLTTKCRHSQRVWCIRVSLATIAQLGILKMRFLPLMHLECLFVYLVGLGSRDLFPSSQVIGTLLLTLQLDLVHLICKSMDSFSLFNLQFSVGHHIRFLVKEISIEISKISNFKVNANNSIGCKQ